MSFCLNDWLERYKENVTQSKIRPSNHRLDQLVWSSLVPEQVSRVREVFHDLLTCLRDGETLVLLREPQLWNGLHHDGPPSCDGIARRFRDNFWVLLQRIGRSNKNDPELRTMRLDRQFGAELHTAEANFTLFQREGKCEIFQGETSLECGDRFIMSDPLPNSSLLIQSEHSSALLTSVMPVAKMHPLPIDTSGFRDLTREEVNEMVSIFEFQHQDICYG